MVHTVTRPTVGELVLESLRDHVLVAGLQPGDSLPPERELAKMFGVSRSTVREVLKSLQMAGAVTRKPNQGTMLSTTGPRFFVQLSHSLQPTLKSELSQLMEARLIVEVAILPLVIERATEADFERMESAVQIMIAKAKIGVNCTAHDIEFHKALLSAAGNKYLEQFGDIVRELGRVNTHKPDAQIDTAKAEEHRQLLESLRNRDLERARKFLDMQLRMPEPDSTESKARPEIRGANN